MKIILNAENSSGLGVKTNEKGQTGAKFSSRKKRPEFHLINEKG